MTVSAERRAWSRFYAEGLAAGFTNDGAARWADLVLKTTAGRLVVARLKLADVRTAMHDAARRWRR